MVERRLMNRCKPLLIAALLALASVAGAEVYVSVDRASVQKNESFTLVLTADDGESGEPDIGALSEDFDILGRNQTSSISIINGQRTSSRRWTYVLLPKAVGAFQIPPISVGGVSSEPVAIEVTPASVEAPGEADIFFEVSLDRDTSWVQAQVIYTIKLYLGVATRQTDLAEPSVDGGEVLIERLGDDRRYDAQVGGRLYTVIERSFAMFPQTSGELTIAPARFSASLWERGRISSPRIFTSEPKQLSVNPVVPPPPEFAGAEWLPAKALVLQADLRPDDGLLDPGEPANVRIEMTALGLLSTQLPELNLQEQPGLRVYPDQPDLQSRATPTSVQSTRQQSFAIIAGRGGVFDLPTLEVPWFNVSTGAWEAATLDLPSLRAAGSVNPEPAAAAQTPVPAPAQPAEPSSPAADAATPTVAIKAELFRLKVINYTLIGLWVVTLWLFWRWSGQRQRQRKKARRQLDAHAPFRGAQKAFKQVHRACNANDAAATRDALLQWARYFWPDAGVMTLGDIIARVPAELREPFEQLNRTLYGAAERWQGDALRRVLNQLNRPGSEARLGDASVLPPLLASADRP